MKPPIPQSYWVAERFAAGEYPGAPLLDDARAKLEALAGIDTFVDLTDANDLLEPYEHLLPTGSRRIAIPLQDLSVPPPEVMVEVLDTIDEELAAGRTVYLHCWGGIGRTGTVVGCWLVRHGMDGPDALIRVSDLIRTTPKHWRAAPETSEQRDAIRTWPPGR